MFVRISERVAVFVRSKRPGIQIVDTHESPERLVNVDVAAGVT
jgi:hypothetical protein